MFINNSKNIKVTFDLRKEMLINPDRINRIQDLTLNKNKPNIGLLGNNGLFCSAEWWLSVENGNIKTKIISGRIVNLYKAGQDNIENYNSFTLMLESGERIEEGIYVLDKKDMELFHINSEVFIIYAYDYLKSGDLLGIVLQMAINISEC